jgi:NADH:ubiquinone oxidoreductase subunit E
MKRLDIKKYDTHVLVCQGDKCGKHSGKEIYKELRHHYKHSDLPVRVSRADCFGECKQACVVVVDGQDSSWFGEVKAKHKHIDAIKEKVEETLRQADSSQMQLQQTSFTPSQSTEKN